MNKKSFENRLSNSNVDAFKISVELNIYDEILSLYNHTDKDKFNSYLIDNCIKVSLFIVRGKNYTHITVYGMKSYNLKKDIKVKDKIDILLNYLVENIPLKEICLKQLDISFDYKLKPENVLIYQRYTDKNNKYIKLHELDNSKSYKDYSLYVHDFKYYKANIYKLVDDIDSFGIKLFEDIKKDLDDEFEKHYTKNGKYKDKKRMLTTYIKDKYYELGLEFIKQENNNYYLYIPKNVYESIEYKSIKDNYKNKKIFFKPDTRKSHLIKYDKSNKVLEKQKTKLPTDLTRVEFVINFDKTLIDSVDCIMNKIAKQLDSIYITDYKIDKKTLKSFEKIYAENNLFDTNIKDKSKNIILGFLNKFK